MAELPQGTVTLVFTDIEGSSRLLASLGAPCYEEVLASHRKLLREPFRFRVADVEDVVAMKRATGREKDAAHLTTLVEFLMDRPATAQRGTEDDD